MGFIDPDSPYYRNISEGEREGLWADVLAMYRKLDDILGVYLKNADRHTLIVLSSDHGAVPLHTWINLNNLFASKGWLKYEWDPETGIPRVDWRESKVVYLKFGHIYVNPDGLHDEAGVWRRGRGEGYRRLRENVIQTLEELTAPDGKKPVAVTSTWEDAESRFKLPSDRVGDVIVANRPGYGWNEEITEDKKIFSVPPMTGYKQAILPEDCPGMWGPFIVAGPGVKENNYLGDEPIEMIDQYPTLLRLLGIPLPDHTQGVPIEKVFDGQGGPDVPE